MKIKYSPIKWNEYANIEAQPDTMIEFIDQNTITVDGQLYEFDNDSIVWPDIYEQTNGVITEARRDETGELYLTVRRFYTHQCIEWDTGDYHEING